MNARKLSRRDALARTGLLVGTAIIADQPGLVAAPSEPPVQTLRPVFRYCLNTATLRGQKLGIVKEIEVAAKAGYQGIEPWVASIEAYVEGGGSLKDLGQRLSDSGLTVEGAIGFPEWLVDDEARRAKYQGICLISLIVDAQGNPQNPRVVQALGMGLDEKALEAVRKYKFKPAMKDGKTPVPVMITVLVNFHLY